MGDLLSAASLMLAVVGILYGLWYSDLMNALGTNVPRFTEDRARPLKEVSNVRKSLSAPLALAATAVALVFLPDIVRIAVDSVRVFTTEGFLAGLSAYNGVATAFFVVDLFAWGLAAYALNILSRLRILEASLRQEGEKQKVAD